MRPWIYSSSLRLLRPRRGVATAYRGARFLSTSLDCVDETVSIPAGNNGLVSLQVTRPTASGPSHGQSSRPNVILYLPPGPLFQETGTNQENPQDSKSSEPGSHYGEWELASPYAKTLPQHVLASTTAATVVTVNYRLGKIEAPRISSLEPTPDSQDSLAINDEALRAFNSRPSFFQYPTPVHDTLAGFDWIQTHLQPTHIAVFGSHIGGSLALMLALTEAQSVRAVTALEPVCDWPGLDEYCATEVEPAHMPLDLNDTGIPRAESSVTAYTKQTRPPKKKTARVASPDLVPLLKAREQLFSSPERCFDAFASPILFLRSAGRDVPRKFPRYLTGPEYPVPVLQSSPMTTTTEQTAASDDDSWDREPDPSLESDEEKAIYGKSTSTLPDSSSGVARRRKALSRWPPYGLDYGLSGQTWSGPGDGISRLELTLPWVRVLLREPLAGLSPAALIDSSSSSHSKLSRSNHPGPGPTVLARQAGEMVSVMRRACFWGREKGFGERRVTLSSLQNIQTQDADSNRDVITREVGEWLISVFEESIENRE
ncbi:hypothetical protein NUU61_009904 [Penicillium alfredii]|uniref:Alpha/beta hydrolase fold-3 domain-containing protein n=1 Tax=Penicillium alfredii TaxID=1506179 RepID=A0A9W9EH70_9EURO|nr:uncharacterized protein NUU61_009904 [Penicillium alfredii]KAJ5081640.1 hypothetical protein NUU61_009904 [Penicillium alfredii]